MKYTIDDARAFIEKITRRYLNDESIVFIKSYSDSMGPYVYVHVKVYAEEDLCVLENYLIAIFGQRDVVRMGTVLTTYIQGLTQVEK